MIVATIKWQFRERNMQCVNHLRIYSKKIIVMSFFFTMDSHPNCSMGYLWDAEAWKTHG